MIRGVPSSRLRVLGLAMLAMVFLGAGCISFGGDGKAGGGLFLSKNRGDTWEQRGAILTTGAPRSLAATGIRVIVQDPGDSRAFYVGTDTSGAFFSWDGGAGWQALGLPFAQARVEAIVIHPKDRCTFFVAAGQKIFRSDDCARSWLSSDFDITVTALGIDPLTPSTLYAGNARGDIMKSADRGRSWQAIHRIDRPIVALRTQAIGASVAVFVATRDRGILRSSDGGISWTDLARGMETYPAAFEYRALALAPAKPGTLLAASRYGILRSVNAGLTWDPIPLLTAPNTVDITGVAVNPTESNEIVYTTSSTFYRTRDGGRTWESKKLPTGRQVTALLVDARDGNVVWMGTRAVEK